MSGSGLRFNQIGPRPVRSLLPPSSRRKPGSRGVRQNCWSSGPWGQAPRWRWRRQSCC